MTNEESSEEERQEEVVKIMEDFKEFPPKMKEMVMVDMVNKQVERRKKQA